MPRSIRFARPFAAFALLSGCGGGGPPVAGVVTRGGTPIPTGGVVQFTPDREKGNAGLTVSINLVAGRFTTVGASDLPPVTPGPQIVTVITSGVAPPGTPEGEAPSVEHHFRTDVPSGGATDLTLAVESAVKGKRPGAE